MARKAKAPTWGPALFVDELIREVEQRHMEKMDLGRTRNWS